MPGPPSPTRARPESCSEGQPREGVRFATQGYDPHGRLVAAIAHALVLNSLKRTSQEIGATGERAVAQELHSRGYRVHRDTCGPSATDVVAVGHGHVLLMQVEAQSPDAPRVVSDAEARRLRARARRLRAAPLEARGQLDWWLQPPRQTDWRTLSN